MSDSETTQTPLQRAIECHRQGDLTGAETGYREVLEGDPNQPDALQLLGVVRYLLGGTEEAIGHIRKSLEVNPRQAGAYENLGRIYAELERWEEAVDCFEQAVALQPAHAAAHRGLGHAQSQVERFEEALISYDRALELDPDDHNSRFHRAMTLQELLRWDDAIAELRELLRRDRERIGAYVELGQTLRQQGRLEEAREVYQQWLDVRPEDPVALHFLAASQGKPAPEQASDDYVRTVFDSFATEFDACLERLDYQAPRAVAERVAEALGPPQADRAILDLGCGTGLCGKLLRPHAASLEGVDLSPKMLDQARELDIYDKLYEAELSGFLTQCNGDYDVIVSADTFCYLGNLERALAGAAQALRPGGWLVFTVEKLETPLETTDAGFQLHRFGRYAHREDYVRDELARAGFDLVTLETAPLRKEGGQPVAGLFATVRKPAPQTGVEA